MSLNWTTVKDDVTLSAMKPLQCYVFPYLNKRRLIDTLEQYTNHKFKFIVIWETKNIRLLFPLKDRVIHKSCVIYHGICTCGITYTGETDRLGTTRWKEQDNLVPSSEHFKHLASYPDPHSTIKRKILEACYIAKYNPKLNEQVSSSILVLFRHGVT